MQRMFSRRFEQLQSFSPPGPPPGGPPTGETPDGTPPPAEGQQITAKQREQLRAPLDPSDYACDIIAVADSGSKAAVRLRPFLEATRRRLREVLGPGGYSFRYEQGARGTEHLILCHLTVGSVVRTGIGAAPKLRPATDRAFVNAGLAFGIGRRGAREGTVIADLEVRTQVSDSVRERLGPDGPEPEEPETP